MIVSQSFQLGQTMLSLVFWGLPYILFVSPCMIIYLRLMAFITYRPINKGLDPKRETVVRKKTNLMTAGETMNLIVITGQCGGGWTTFIILDLCILDYEFHILENCPIIYILLDLFKDCCYVTLLSVDGSHAVRDVHRPGPQHQDEPESAAVHLLRHPDHGLSHRDPRDSGSPGL